MSVMIETKTASLETFSVTIQALHVNGKQMTLAVFRQLPIANDIGECEFWGIVRYRTKNENACFTTRDEADLWLVFSAGEKLFRRAIFPDQHWFPSDAAKTLRYKLQTHPDRAPRKEEQQAIFEAEAEEAARASRDANLISTLPQLFIAV